MDYLGPPHYSSQDHASYTQLKRSNPPEHSSSLFDKSSAPPLPTISNTDRVLQVFTHPSIRTKLSGPSPDQFPDNERLSKLGKVVLDSVIMEILFDSRPILRAEEMIARRQDILCDESFEDWVFHYKLLQKVRYDPVLRESSGITKPQETRDIFYAYVAGVYIDSGAAVVRRWIGQLLGQNGNATASAGTSTISGSAASSPMIVDDRSPPMSPPPTKRVKAESMSPDPQSPPIFFGSQPTMPPAPKPPMHQAFSHPPAMSLPRVNPLAPARPGLPFLPLFNQTAAQRRVTVTYDAQFSGPSHAGTWIVRCIVNGIPKGEGTGNSKQNAKEEAARQAYYAMGWT